MAERYDPYQALTTDWKTYLFDRRKEMFILPCVEGDVEIQGNWLLINILLCLPLIRRRRPISRDEHLILSGIYDAKVHAETMTKISRTLENLGYKRVDLGYEMISTVMDMHNLCYTHLGGYIRGMDIFAIHDTISQPEVRKAVTMDYGNIADGNITRMETAFKDQCEKVDVLLSNNRPDGSLLKYNVFHAPLVCGALKKGQFFQFVISAGPRTDTDDHVFLRPVLGSFLSGMSDIKDMAIESRSAAKATHYNKTQMAITQYGNRKLHIQASVVWRLYQGDCGSTTYMTFEPNERFKKNYLGTFYLDKSGREIELTPDRYSDVVGKPTKFRNPITCRYTDGYCERCGGTITRSFSRDGNVGFLSNVNTGAPVAQQVLSTKHLTSTDAVKYVVPEELENILMAVTNDIYLRPAIRRSMSILALGFHQKDINRLNDLKYYTDTNELHAAYFTAIKYMAVGQYNPETDMVTQWATRTPMGGETKTYPHLSPEVLQIICEHGEEDIKIQGNTAWLLMRHVDPNRPIMQCTVVNNSIKRFVKKFSDLITKEVERYRSANAFMSILTQLIWPRVDTHITHASALVRASLVTSKTDFHIPVVTNPDDVKFGTLNRNIPNRSIGGLFAYQGIDVATNKPATYIIPKLHSVMDEYMGYSDTVVRDMHWPKGHDVLEEVPFVRE